MENIVLFDWLSATMKTPLVNGEDKETQLSYAEHFISALGLDAGMFTTTDGPHGKNNRLWLDGINIHLPNETKNYVWLEMSGSGCRAFETYGHGNWNSLLEFCVNNSNIKRLDCAFDDHNQILDMQQLVIDTYFNRSFISRSHYHEVQLSFDDRTGDEGTSIYHGRECSNILIRIYDKAAQLRRKDEKWNRVEIQMRDSNAMEYAQKFVQGSDLGSLWAGVLVYYLRYCEPSDSDSNKWRWHIKDYWKSLIGDAESIKLLTTPGVEYNMTKLENYVMHQAGNSIWTYIQAFGYLAFREKLEKSLPAEMPVKYKDLLKRFKAGDKHV